MASLLVLYAVKDRVGTVHAMLVCLDSSFSVPKLVHCVSEAGFVAFFR
jgi:hypothetical protein